MKTVHRNLIMIGILALALMGAAGCKSTPAKTSSQSGSGQNQAAGVPAGMSGTRGVITAVSSGSITIAVMPQGSGAQFGGGMGQPPQGSAQPGGSGAPQQPQPSGSAPQGAAPQATQDTSSWEKQTFAIDSSTKIVQGQVPGSTGTQSSGLTAADLKAGESVLIAERSGTAASTASQITVMQGMGGPQGAGPGSSAPADTANS